MTSRSISGPPFRAGVALLPGRFAHYKPFGSLATKKPSLPGLRISFTLWRHHSEVDLEAAPASVLDVAVQGFVNDREGQRVPGDVRMLEKLDLQALGASAEGGGAHPAAENHIDLADMRDAEDGVKRGDLDVHLGFLQGLPGGGLLGGFALLHEPGGHRPQTVFRLDGPPAKQDLLPPLRDAPDHDLWVFIMDGLAGVAHKTGQIVAGRNFLRDRRPAIAAEVHGQVPFAGIMPQVNGRG